MSLDTAEVQPLDRFPMDEAGRIIAGHYVIERNGKAITAQIGSAWRLGQVVVQYMCGGLLDVVRPRKWVEAGLFGRYVPDPAMEAEISEGLQRLLAAQLARQTAPHLKRGAA